MQGKLAVFQLSKGKMLERRKNAFFQLHEWKNAFFLRLNKNQYVHFFSYKL